MISIRGLDFKYFPNRKIFKGLDLEFEQGRVYGIIGRNGSGKTTLLDIVSGMIPGYKGSVSMDGMEAGRRHPDYLGKIYYIPESPNHSSYSMRDMILLGRLYPNWKEERFLKFMEQSGFTMKTRNSRLSRGWKKRVQVSFALSVDPEVLVLDEVTDGIDMIGQRAIVDDLIEYTDEKKTVIFSSHHAGEMQTVIEDIILIENGAVLYSGNLEDGLGSMGWVPGDKKSALKKKDILDEKVILGKTHVLFKNTNAYDLDHAAVTLPEFMEYTVKMDKEGLL